MEVAGACERALVCATDWVCLPGKAHHRVGKPFDIERDKRVEGLCGPISKCNRPFSHQVCSHLHDANSLARINDIMATESASGPTQHPGPTAFSNYFN